MAMSATFTNFLGLVAETRSGVERIYVSDTLGSTQEITDASGATTDTFEYWSYGEERSHSGSSATQFTWLGTLGYFKDILNKLYYVRARFMRPDLGRWQTVDLLWPQQPPYVYCTFSPQNRVDPSGLDDGCDVDKSHCEIIAAAEYTLCILAAATACKLATAICQGFCVTGNIFLCLLCWATAAAFCLLAQVKCINVYNDLLKSCKDAWCACKQQNHLPTPGCIFIQGTTGIN